MPYSPAFVGQCGWMDERCFRPLLCTVKAEFGPGTTWANEMNVVYKFKCLRDANNIYIGKTIRHLATRVKEHGTSPSNSAVSNHLTSCESCKLHFSSDSFSIMDSGKNDFEVTKESSPY